MTRVQYSVTVAAVLNVFLDEPDVSHYGLDILRRLGLGSGTVYPILKRLSDAGWLTSTLEDVNVDNPGRVRRRWYRLTEHGHRHAKAFTGDIRNLRPSPRTAPSVELHPTQRWYAPGSTVAILEYLGKGHWAATETTVDRVSPAQVFTTAGSRFWRKNMMRVGRSRVVFRMVPRDNVHAVAALGPPTTPPGTDPAAGPDAAPVTASAAP